MKMDAIIRWLWGLFRMMNVSDTFPARMFNSRLIVRDLFLLPDKYLVLVSASRAFDDRKAVCKCHQMLDSHLHRQRGSEREELF